jgi:pimeloyl-ACP methyl ester carboxylesterase
MNSASKTRGRRLLAVAGFLAVLVAAVAPASAAPQQRAAQTSATAAAVATDQSHRPSTKPTLVLVHGAWADGSSWSKVTRRLQNDGFTVRVPPNPLRSLPGDAATIRDFLSTLSGPIVLVAHSYGGAVITNAATGTPNVKALVYVDAFAPAEGEVIFPLVGADSALVADPTTVFDFVPYPGAPPGDVDLYLKHNVFLTSFATGVPRPEAELLYASQRPLTLSSGNQPSGPPAWATIPSWYVLGTQDAIITPTAQQFMAERAHAQITRVKAGHLSLITQPQQVTAVIEQAVRATN